MASRFPLKDGGMIQEGQNLVLLRRTFPAFDFLTNVSMKVAWICDKCQECPFQDLFVLMLSSFVTICNLTIID